MPTVTVIQPTITEEQNTKIRCAAYCRVSSDSEDQLNSFMAQTRYYSQFFENSETEELIDLYADEGITGTREDKRDEFQRMIKDCRKGRIDRIYTKSISRFARNTKDCLKNVREEECVRCLWQCTLRRTYTPNSISAVDRKIKEINMKA